MLALSLLTLNFAALQDPERPVALPVQPGVTIVQVVAGDTYQARDYEAVIRIESAAGRTVTLGSTAFVKDRAGIRRWLSVTRTVLAEDLRAARTMILGFDTDDAERLPGTTALGPSRLVLDELRRTGRTATAVRNFAARPDNTGTLERVERGTVAFPLLVNGVRVSVPALHARGQLLARGVSRPWEFWFLDHPLQPLTLKVMYGAEGETKAHHPEWSRQIVRIDIPLDIAAGEAVNPEFQEGAGGVAGSPEPVGGGAGGALPAGDIGPGAGGGVPEGTGGQAGMGTGGDGAGVGTGAGLGAGAGMERRLATQCRVPVPGIYFEFDSDMLNPASAPWVRSIADLLRRHPEWTITIEGHTDSVGGARYNHDLSTRRAAALKRSLTNQHAIAAGRLSPRGFGPDRPLESNATPEGRARNRRVELVRPCDRPTR